jgi:hypothetical protein
MCVRLCMFPNSLICTLFEFHTYQLIYFHDTRYGWHAIGRQLLLVLLTVISDSSATVVRSCGKETTLRSLQVCGACCQAVLNFTRECFYANKGNMWGPGGMSVSLYDAASDDRNR